MAFPAGPLPGDRRDRTRLTARWAGHVFPQAGRLALDLPLVFDKLICLSRLSALRQELQEPVASGRSSAWLERPDGKVARTTEYFGA